MPELSLEQATAILDRTLESGRQLKLQPLTVAILDDGGHLKAFKREDGSGAVLRPQIAIAKAFGAVGMGQSSRRLGEIAEERPHLVNALIGVSYGRLVPVPGGVLIRDPRGAVLGAVGVSGDSSENDEAVAVAGLRAAGFEPEI